METSKIYIIFTVKNFQASFFSLFYGDFGFLLLVIALGGKLEAVFLDLKMLRGEILEDCWDFRHLKSQSGHLKQFQFDLVLNLIEIVAS
jgi:hypothetical protein